MKNYFGQLVSKIFISALLLGILITFIDKLATTDHPYISRIKGSTFHQYWWMCGVFLCIVFILVTALANMQTFSRWFWAISGTWIIAGILALLITLSG